MKRAQNKLNRHVEDYRVERQEMLDWIRQACSLTHQPVTEFDWLMWEHMRPEDWLAVTNCPDLYEDTTPMSEADWDDVIEDNYDYGADYEEYLDWEATLEDCAYRDSHQEFGGRMYPRGHVEQAKQHSG